MAMYKMYYIRPAHIQLYISFVVVVVAANDLEEKNRRRRKKKQIFGSRFFFLLLFHFALPSSMCCTVKWDFDSNEDKSCTATLSKAFTCNWSSLSFALLWQQQIIQQQIFDRTKTHFDSEIMRFQWFAFVFFAHALHLIWIIVIVVQVLIVDAFGRFVWNCENANNELMENLIKTMTNQNPVQFIAFPFDRRLLFAHRFRVVHWIVFFFWFSNTFALFLG